MTTVQEVDLAVSESLWYEGSNRMRPSPEVMNEQWRDYFDEGHLVALIHREDDPGFSWFAYCTCGDNTWGLSPDEMKSLGRDGTSGAAKPIPQMHNFGQVRYWATDHRLEQRLEKQDFCPSFTVDELAEIKARYSKD